jgi:hypothetical protein
MSRLLPHLGTAVRTAATGHQKPDCVPSAEMRQALDTTVERAGEGAQARFARNAAGMPSEGLTKAAEDATVTTTSGRPDSQCLICDHGRNG